MNALYRTYLLIPAGGAVLAAWIVGVSSVALAGSDGGRLVVESPLHAVERQDGGVVKRLTLDPTAYRNLRSHQQVTLRNFVLGDGLQVDVELERVNVFAPGARLVLGSTQGDRPMPEPDILLFNGHVVGRPDSTVFLGLSPHGSNGLVTIENETFVISSGPRPGNGDTVAYNLTKLPRGTIDWLDWRCMTDPLALPAQLRRATTPTGSSDSASPAEPCRVAEIAIDTDWEFTAFLFPSGEDASSAYVALLIGAVSEIYARDFNVKLQIGYLRIWTEQDDPWDQTNTGDQLVQFRNYWNANMTDVPRHVAHYLSGRWLGGGIAYVPGLCNTWWDYGLSAVDGHFPYPLQNNVAQNWDPYVVAHEIGHNFGAPHTHGTNPPIDNCGNDDCTNSSMGTIMSYCHGCPGGMSNIRLEFHPRMIDEFVLPYVGSRGCLLPGGVCGCVDDTECDDGDPCTDDACLAPNCEYTSNSAPCDDGLFCNGDDTCADGSCSQHVGSPCDGAGCVEETDHCPCNTDLRCDDGNACNGAETCDTETGECLPGTAIVCDDGNECNGVESCDPETGDCFDGDINDCDDNSIDDACDLAGCDGDPGCDDCDGNGGLDRCDIAGGQSDVNGNGTLDQCEPPCIDNASCHDSNPCSFDRCIENLCWNDADARFGDVASAEGVCGPDDNVDLFDILAVLNGFEGRFAEGCELVNIDIAGDQGSCFPNDQVDVSDILGVLDAFQGLDRCCAATP